MTAYAVVDARLQGRTFRLHLKSVNHRYFEFRWKAPRAWMAAETPARAYFQKALVRGSLDFWIEDTSSEETSARNEAAEFFMKLESTLRQLPKISGWLIPTPFRALLLMRFPELWLATSTKSDLGFEEVRPYIEKLTEAFLAERQREGQGIQSALAEETRQLRAAALKITSQVVPLRQEIERTTTERLRESAKNLGIEAPGHERLLQEWLILAEKKDIAEELQRISSHLQLLEEWLVQAPDHAGKRLDFLMQELHREWTTLGNKIQNAEIAQTVMAAKLSIEKIREQALNLC